MPSEADTLLIAGCGPHNRKFTRRPCWLCKLATKAWQDRWFQRRMASRRPPPAT